MGMCKINEPPQCPCGQIFGIDWNCVNEKWALYNGGNWGITGEFLGGMGGTLLSFFAKGGVAAAGGYVSGAITMYGGITWIAFMFQCEKCHH